MSVVQIFDQTSPLISGYSMRSRYITDSLKELGVPLKVYSSPIHSYERQEESINGVPYFHCVGKNWDMIRKIPLVKHKAVINTIRETIADRWSLDNSLLDAHSPVLNGKAAAQLADKFKTPLLYEIRALWEDAAVDQGKTRVGSLRYNMTRAMETDVVNRADHVTVICEGLKNDLLKRGVPEEKITIIPNGVDTEKFQPMGIDEELREELGFKDCMVFGFIGSFFHFEGLELFVKAAKQILNKNKDIRFILVGSGPQEETLHRMAQEYGLENKLIFTGRVNHDEVQKFYSVIDVCVYPRISKRITELVTPLKPLEAMALEKIVIASDVGGLKELVQEGRNGFLFKAGSTHELAEKCLYVVDHFSEMESLAKSAREYVVQERNWMEICKNYLPIFESLGVTL